MLRPIYTAGVTIVTRRAGDCSAVLASPGEVLMPALQHDLPVLHEVLHHDRALHHARESPGAGVLREPLRAADRRRAVATARPEAPVHRAEERAARALARRVARPHLAGALEVAPADQLHLGQ